LLDPVAIIGIGCRFPGVRDTESLWRLFRDGVDVITEVPADRWDIDFCDARFFGVAPYQIEQIDSQQRFWRTSESRQRSYPVARPAFLLGSVTVTTIGSFTKTHTVSAATVAPELIIQLPP
jgi:hypothetical protein